MTVATLQVLSERTAASQTVRARENGLARGTGPARIIGPVRSCAACRRRGPIDSFIRLGDSAHGIFLTRIGRWIGCWCVWPPAANGPRTSLGEPRLASPDQCEHNTAPRSSADPALTGGRRPTGKTTAGGVRGCNLCARGRCLHQWLSAAGRSARKRAGAANTAGADGGPDRAGRMHGAEAGPLALAVADRIEALWTQRADGLRRRGIESRSDVRSQAWLSLRDELRSAAQPAPRRPGDQRGRATSNNGARE